MDKRLLFSAILAAGIGASEAQAQKVSAPTISNPLELNPATMDGTDTVYIYNVKAQKWLVNGNAYGTQTSLGDKGMKVAIIPNKTNGEWNGTFSLYNDSNSPKEGAEWTRRIFFNAPGTDGGNSYVDRGSQAEWKCNWVIIPKGKSFELQTDTIKANSSLWESDYATMVENARAGWNPNDSKVDGKGEEATSEIFRPALNMTDEGAAGYGVEWQAYAEKDYLPYASRVVLMKAINEAVDEGVNVSQAITVYNNANATVEEIEAATQLVSDARRNATMVTATAEAPVNITEYVKDANCDALTGWTHECVYDADGNVGSGGHGTNWQAHSAEYTADDGFKTSKFIERWVNSSSNPDTNNEAGTGHLSDGVISQKLTNLLAGGYKVSCYAMATQQGKSGYSVEGASVFANTDSQQNAQVVATDAGAPKKFEFFVTVKDGESLELGFKLDKTTANWVFVDEFSVEYYGTDAQAMLYQDLMNTVTSLSDNISGNDAFCPDYSATANELIEKASGMSSASAEEIADVKAKLVAVQKDIETSRANYVELTSLVDKINEGYAAEGFAPTDELTDLFENGDTYGETAEDLLSTYTLNNEKLAEFLTKLKAAFEESQNQSIKPGTDISDRIENATFDTGDATGWSGAQTVSKDYQNAEAYQKTFDMYQELTNLPDGVYELSAQAMARMTWNAETASAHEGGTEVITAVLYANEMSTPFASPFSAWVSETEKVDNEYEWVVGDEKRYTPNSMKAFQAICAASEDNYKVTVPVLVEGGKLRIGVKETTRPTTNGDWAIWDNFKLTYVGGKGEALNVVTVPLIEKAKTYLNNKMNADTLANLNKAIAALEAEGTIEGIHAVNAAISAAETSIAAYKPLLSAIDNVKSRYTANEKVNTTSEAAKAIYNTALETAQNAYNDGAIADDKVEDAITALNAGFTQYVVNDAVAVATEANPVDVSAVIANNDFATMDKSGWTVKSGSFGFQAGNGVEAGEFYNCTFNVQQKITGLPAGKYIIKSQAFYRNGNSATATVGEDDNQTLKYNVNENAYLYYAINDSTQADSVALKTITAATITEENLNEYAHLGNTDGLVLLEGLGYIPNNMITAQAYFNSEVVGSNFETEPLTIVYDGKSEFYVGAFKNVAETNDWTIIGNFTLQYAGKTDEPVTEIKDIDKNTGSVIGTRIFNAAGVQTGKLQKGINIVETTLSDGSKKVSKIIVK